MMSFVSFKFLLFLGLTFFVYFAGPKKAQWIVLLVFSYLYYYLCSYKLIVVLFGFSFFAYFMGRAISATNDKKKRKLLTKLGVSCILVALIVMKYSNFLILNMNTLFGTNISLWNMALPIGISYYTLQSISYLCDVNKKRCEAETNLFRFLLYMSYFPQITQGPIPKYKELSAQLYSEHDFDYVRITHGLQLMGWGIAKKIILADRLSLPVSYIFDHYSEFHGMFIFFGAILYGFQIYADFSGGIDTVRGISEVFGITLGQNFNQPYCSRSVEDFWRRWHISLGNWMREYIFYPLSLSKKLNNIGKRLRKTLGDNFGKKFAPFVSMFIVYFLVGMWHGPEWKYVAYGIWNGLFIMCGIVLEDKYLQIRRKLRIKPESRLWAFFQIFRTFIIVSLGRLLSRADSLSDALNMFRLIFTKTFDFSFFSTETLVTLGISIREWILCLIVILIILFMDHLKEKGIRIREWISQKNIVIRWAFYLLLIMAILIFGKYGPGYDAASFIYGNY